MARAHSGLIPVQQQLGGLLSQVANATAAIRQTGTTAAFTGNVWAAASGGTAIGSTVTITNGVLEFWLDSPQRVDAYITATGFTPQTITIDAVDPTAVGSYSLALGTKTSAYTVIATDDAIVCDATAGAFTVTLPFAATRTRPLYIVKKDSSANPITIAAAGSETITGLGTRPLSAQYETALLISDQNTSWIEVL